MRFACKAIEAWQEGGRSGNDRNGDKLEGLHVGDRLE